jgi:pre-mRNA-processing factor SLU7
VERPRKKGAKYTGKDIKPDEVSVELAYDYAGKRDHWQQFDPSAHMAMIRAHEREAETRRKAAQQRKMGELAAKEQQRERRQKKKEGGQKGDGDGSGTDTDTDTDGSDGKASDEERVAETEQLSIGQDVKAPAGRAKSSVRNLRIREDTAKYLLNLDVSSAYYDPKTRAMRENPLPGGGEEDGFAGDNFQRASGDAAKLAALQMYEMEAFDKGQNMQMNADPTTVEMMNRIYREKKEKLKDTRSNKILDKYGGQQHMEAPPKELLFAQTESYVEYDRSGGVVQGQEKVVARSKYEEDVLTHNHVEIWGSFFDRATFRWGYADDHSTLRNSYSTGAAGRRAREMAAAALKAPAPTRVAGQATPALADKSNASLEQRALYGTGEGLGDAPLDAEKLKAAMAAEAKRKGAGAAGGGDDRKRKYNSMQAEEVTAESMEAYYRSKSRGDDPMAGT